MYIYIYNVYICMYIQEVDHLGINIHVMLNLYFSCSCNLHLCFCIINK